MSPLEAVKTKADVIKQAMYNTAVYVAERLLQQESLLLPYVHRTFSATAADIALTANLDLGEDEALVTARWILSNLVVYLQHHLEFYMSY